MFVSLSNHVRDNLEILHLWIIGASLTGNGRQDHACAHIRHINGSNYVIAAGGKSGGTYTDTSEILDADNVSNGWFSGIFLKFQIEFCTLEIHLGSQK